MSTRILARLIFFFFKILSASKMLLFQELRCVNLLPWFGDFYFDCSVKTYWFFFFKTDCRHRKWIALRYYLISWRPFWRLRRLQMYVMSRAATVQILGNLRWRPGRIKVGRWNERVRAKRCDAVEWDSAKKCRLFSTSFRACDVLCTLEPAVVTELWQLDLFSCTSFSFLCAGTLSPRGKCCYFLREV